MDREVGKGPVDRHYCPDRPLRHVDKGHRGERVDLAVEGELAPAGHDHHQDVHLVVPMRLDAIPQAEPDQVGLQVLSGQPPQGAWPVPGRREAGQVDRRNSVAHPTMFSSHTGPDRSGVKARPQLALSKASCNRDLVAPAQGAVRADDVLAFTAPSMPSGVGTWSAARL